MANDTQAAKTPEGLPADPGLMSLRDDQIRRWRSGQRPSVEHYVAGHPNLPWDADALLDFAFGELLLRKQLGERPTLDEYAERFPELASALRIQARIDNLLDSRIEALETTPAADRSPLPELFRQERTIAGISPLPTARTPSLNGYVILEELGRGGMGVVYKARQLKPNRIVAVKVMLANSHASVELAARFAQESDAIARLQHPNIIQVIEVGESEGMPYLTLDWAEGGSLERRLDGTPRPVEWSADLIEKLSRAVHHAHTRGIIHRDLKPANVLFTLDNTPKLTDFGLAKILDTPLGQTITNHLLGTPCYMAPEQARDGARDVGAEADVYSLGAMLYELLTGRPPFRASTPASTIQLALTHQPVPPTRLRPDLASDVETIVLKCLQKDPWKRYLTAEDLAEDLARFRRGEQIHARPASLSSQLITWAIKHPIRAFAASKLILTVILLPFVLGWFLLRTYTSLQAARGEIETLTHNVRVEKSALLAEQKKQEGRNSEFSLAMRSLTGNTLAADDLLAEAVGDPPSKALLATRRRSLEQSARALRDVLQRHGGQYDIGDELTRKILVQLLRRLSIVADLSGQPADADDASREALSLEQASLDLNPEALTARIDMARAWMTEGDRQLNAHRGRRALDAFQYAERAYHSVVGNAKVNEWLKTSGLTGYQLHRESAAASREISLVQGELSQPGEALAAQKRAVQAMSYAVAYTVGGTQGQLELAQALVRLGDLLTRSGEIKEARQADLQAIELLKVLVDLDLLELPDTISGDQWIRYSQQAEIHEWLGGARSRIGDETSARNNFLRAIEIQQAVLDRYSGDPPRRALVRLRSHLEHWGQFELQNHHVEAALDAARSRASLAADEPGETFQAARLFSMAFQQSEGTSRHEDESLGEEAVQLLKTAIDQGIEISTALRDPAFTSLRKREDFQKLVEEAERATKP